MNKNFAMATLGGTVVLFVLGWVLYGMLLMGFFESNAGTATGVMKEAPDFLWLILGQIVTAAFLALVLGWKGATDVASGAKAGAIVGFLLSLGYGLTMYATSNTWNLSATLVDPFISLVLFGAAGAVVGLLLGKGATP